MRNDRKQLVFMMSYSCILFISYVVFLYEPEWRIAGIAWNSVFLVLGSTIGTSILVAVSVVSLVRKRMSIVVFSISVAQLLIISALCFMKAFDILMGV